MKPFWYSSTSSNNSKQQLEKNKVCYIGVCSSCFGFMLLFVSWLVGSKELMKTAFAILISPFLISAFLGILEGILMGTLYASKELIDNLVLLYLGYDYEELKNKLER